MRQIAADSDFEAKSPVEADAQKAPETRPRRRSSRVYLRGAAHYLAKPEAAELARQARALRKLDWTYPEIAEELNLKVWTVTHYCSDRPTWRAARATKSGKAPAPVEAVDADQAPEQSAVSE